MKVLTLHQPWASMLVTDRPGTTTAIKEWETRGWQITDPKILRELRTKGFLVHAGLEWKKHQKDIIKEWPFEDYFETVKPLLLGVIIGHAVLGEILTTEGWKVAHNHLENEQPQEEYRFGDYSENRFAFQIVQHTKFTNFHRVSGQRKFWDFGEGICLKCGCTNENCIACIQKTGQPCTWVHKNLCSACA